ncbi:MAG: hypothetical protein ACSLFI_05660 [Solirubrobacterales bacterium]
MVSRFGFRIVALAAVFGLAAGSFLLAGQGAAGKPAKNLKLGKEGLYTQTFKNDPGVPADDTSITVFTKNRKITEVWVTSYYKHNGGKWCWPSGTTGAMLPDKTLLGPVSLMFDLKAPRALNAKNKFTIKAAELSLFMKFGGSIKGTLLPSGRMRVTARMTYPANPLQAACGTVITVPKAKFSAF